MISLVFDLKTKNRKTVNIYRASFLQVEGIMNIVGYFSSGHCIL